MTLILFLASTSTFANLADDLLAIQNKYQVPSLSLAFIDGDSSTQTSSGVRKLNDPTLIQKNDLFHLGSCTKAMTATLLAILIENNQLQWTSRIVDLFPEVSLHPDFQSLSIEQLSSHRSGITGSLENIQNGQLWSTLWNPNLNPQLGRKTSLEQILSQPASSPPTSKFEYSNWNYILLGAVIERITGQSWEDVIQEKLFKPLQMKSCGFGSPAHANSPSVDQPWPHRYNTSLKKFEPLIPDFQSDNPPSLGPAGTVHCTLQDWGRFLRAHRDGFNQNDTVILKASSYVKLHQSYPNQEYTYGGWFRSERAWANGPVLNHAGSNTYNYAVTWIAPLKNQILMGVSNAGEESIVAPAVDEAISLLLK